MIRERLLHAGRVGLLAALYVTTARLGLMLDAVSGFATLVWPPTGISLAALLLFGYRLWPGVALGAFVANAWAGAPWPVAIGITAGNTAEAVLATYALRRVPGFRPSLDRVGDVLGLLVLAALLSPLVSATVGVASLALGGVVSFERFLPTWRAWWLGDVIGDLVVAPLLLVWLTKAETPTRRPSWPGEVLGLAALTATTSLLVFGGLSGGAASALGQPYVFFPVVALAALRFGLRGATATIFVISVVAIAATALGHGPFVRPALSDSLFALQAFMAVTAAMFLLVAAAVSERARAVRELEEAHGELEKRVERRTAALVASNAELQRREAQLAEAQEIAHIGSFEWDVAGNRVTWTDELYRIFGLAPRELDAVDAAIREACRAGGSFSIEERIVRPDGEVRVLHSQGRAVTGPDGGPLRVWGSCQDITDRKRAEGDLRRAYDELELRVRERTAELSRSVGQIRESEARKDGILQAALDCIITIDHEGNIVEFNPAAERTFGYAAADVMGKEMATLLIPPHLRRAHREGMARHRATGQGAALGKRIEFPALRADGTEFPAEIAISVVRTDGPPLFTGHLRDITERKRSEEERARLLNEAEEAVRARDAFLSIASHELKTPLTALQLQVDILSRAVGTAPAPTAREPHDVAKRVAQIHRHVGRVAKLIDNLLDVSRITAGRLNLEIEKVDLRAVVEDVVSRSAEEARRAGCAIRLDAKGSAVGHWDRMRVEQIASNLISNAIKYGAGKPIEITIETEGSTARLSVRDHGIGIAPQLQSRIFERFERLVSAREYGGLGLGLWIVRQIIDALGGTVRVSSVEGAGSTFTVELPCLSAGKAEPGGPAAGAEEAGPRVLVVEDDPDILDGVASVLESEGYRVVRAANGNEALEHLRRGRPQVILLDLMMPVMNGWRFLEEQRKVEEFASIPVMLLSADGNLPQKTQALGVRGYIAKPVKTEDLLAAVERCTAAPHRPPARPRSGEAGT
jgi:PAS domain S-box-containing protein